MQNLERRMQKIVAREIRRFSEKCQESRQEESTEMRNASIRRQEESTEMRNASIRRQEESTEMRNASIRRQEEYLEMMKEIGKIREDCAIRREKLRKETEELTLLLEKHTKKNDELHEFNEWCKNILNENALHLAEIRKEREAFRNEFPDLFSQ